MQTEVFPTDNPKALRDFVQGREQLRRYLGEGRSDQLEQAEQSFAAAEESDPEFHLATFFHAITQNELRDSVSAISRFESLVRDRVDFLPEVYVHLAYAHTKNYSPDDFKAAEDALAKASKEAEQTGRTELEPLIDAYRVFLYAVLGGRGDEETRAKYLTQAVELGERLLANRKRLRNEDFPALEVEVHNALGIAYMRQGEQAAPDSSEQLDLWERADSEYRAGLSAAKGAVRLLQNRGTLRKIQGDLRWRQGRADEAQVRYGEAIELYEQSRKINPWDGFSYYRLAELYAKVGAWKQARQHLKSGREKMSGVKESSWERIRAAVKAKDASQLFVSKAAQKEA